METRPRGLHIVTLRAIFLVATCFGYSQAAENLADPYHYGYDPHPDFVAFDPHYREVHDRLSRELDALHADLLRQQKSGRKTFCSREIFLECRWLVHYTADYARTEQKLKELREVLAAPRDPHGREQVESDGSFAPCCDAWWLRMDMTCDELITLSHKWQEPKYPVKLLEKINSPEKLREYLDSVLISDIRKTGINNRVELNMASADLQRFVLYEGTMKELPTKFDLDPRAAGGVARLRRQQVAGSQDRHVGRLVPHR